MKRIFNIPATLVSLRSQLTMFDDGTEVLAKGMHYDKLCWLLDKLANTHYYTKRVDRDSYLPLQCNMLREVCGKRYADLLMKFLLANDIIETNNHYKVGAFAMGYRLTEEHRNARKVCVFNQDSRFLSKLEVADRSTDGETYLVNSLKQDVGIRYSDLLLHLFPFATTPYVGTKHQLETEEDLTSWNDHLAHVNELLLTLPDTSTEVNRLGKVKSPRASAASLLMSAGRIYTGQFFKNRDLKGGRLHTNITNLSTEGRRFLVLNGHTDLINTDIPASQLVFACVPLLKYYEAIETPKDVVRWISLCTSPDPYERLHLEMYKELFDDAVAGKYYRLIEDDAAARKHYRKDFKSKFFASIYYSELKFNIGSLATPESQFMWTHYPSVMQWIVGQKVDDYAAFACNMQRAESDFVIDVFGYQAMKWMLPVVTIHDSALVPAEFGRNVVQYFQSWLDEALRISDCKVKLKAEFLSEGAKDAYKKSFELF